MKIAPLESTHYALLNRTKRRFLLGSLFWGERCQKVSSYLPPVSVISQWVFNCFPMKMHCWKAHIFLYSAVQSNIIHSITTSQLRIVKGLTQSPPSHFCHISVSF